MKKLTVILLVLLAGCVADPENLKKVAVSESERLAKPSVQLSVFSSYDLRPIVLSNDVTSDKDKVKQAAVLEKKIKDKLEPLFAKWSSSKSSTLSHTLIVRPELQTIRIVSGGARFWAGALVGNSTIDMDLVLIDGQTKKVIAKPRISRHAGAMTGAWSVGQSDENLHDYIANITHQYFLTNY